jgi:ATP-binding cassette subfamily F protein uup
MVIELDHIVQTFGEQVVVRDFSTRIMRGDRIGLVGPNGIGKSTLLRIILGELQPDTGRVRHGTRLSVAYFDQRREQLDPEATLWETVCPHGGDMVTVGGKQRHVVSYLAEFLFPPHTVRGRVKTLSGGERNRLLLARLFTQPANLLVLDEPTNDLDIDTLELLEELLQDYPGTVFLVSHDRAFLDNVVTQVIAFESDGVLREYPGGYSDWEAAQVRMKAQAESKREIPMTATPSAAPKQTFRDSAPASVKAGTAKLSSREKQELDALPLKIEQLEANIAAIQMQLADPAFYSRDADAAKTAQRELKSREIEAATAYARWEALEARR